MTFETIFRDIGELEARLFDHRPVVQADINYFTRQFENKISDEEFVRGETTLQNVMKLNTETIPRCNEAMSESVSDVIRKLKAASDVCDRTAAKESVKHSTFLASRRERREADWAAFIQRQCERSAKVDQDYNDQVETARNHYVDLEGKLSANSKAAL